MKPCTVKGRPITFASLFCGCGGLDIGFIRRGFKCVAAFDNDPVAIRTHILNFGCPAAIRDLSSGPLDLCGTHKLDVLLAGSPCQGFSTAGKRRLRDPRNALLNKAGRIAVRLRPQVFLAENVCGVLAEPHKQHWDHLGSILRRAGYRTATLKCRTHMLGMAQTRTRVILIAWLNGANPSFRFPECPATPLRVAFKGVESCSDHEPQSLPAGSRLRQILSRIGPGQKLSNVRSGPRSVHTWHIPEVFGTTTSSEREVLEVILRLRRRERTRTTGDADPVRPQSVDKVLGRPVGSDIKSLVAKGFLRKIGGRYDLRHTFNGKFRRLAWDKPSLAVDTRFGDPRYFVHPDEDRGLTVREAARIQGFPDDFRFLGSKRQQYRLIGNAVPPPLAEVLADVVKEIVMVGEKDARQTE